MMDLEETLEDDGFSNRAPPAKRPRNSDKILEDLESPDVVGDQTVSCQTMWVQYKLAVSKRKTCHINILI